jgi:hypothetical protein
MSQKRMDQASALWWKLTKKYDAETDPDKQSLIMALRARASYLFTMNQEEDEYTNPSAAKYQFHDEISSAGMITGRITTRIYKRYW